MGPQGFLNPTLNSSKSFAEEKLEILREEFDIGVCTQHAGDLLYVLASASHFSCLQCHVDTCWLSLQQNDRTDYRYVPTAWHHATVNLGETVGLSWREQFLESAPSLEVAAAKWTVRQRRAGPVRPGSRMRSAGQQEGAGKRDEMVDETTGGVIFDLWLSDDEVIQAQRELEGLRDIESRLKAEAEMPTREQMIQALESRRKASSSSSKRLGAKAGRDGKDGEF